MGCVIKYKGQSIPEEQFLQYFNKQIAINNLFNENKTFANSVYAALGFTGNISDEQKQQAQQFYSQYLDSLNKPNTNPILQNNQEEQVKKFTELQERLNNKEFLEGAKNAYESTPDLQQLGTQEEYNDYIARVSLGIIKNPSSGDYNYESQVKDIVYHGSYSKNIDKFSKDVSSRTSLTGFLPKAFYFTNQQYVAATYTAPKDVYNRAVWSSLVNFIEGFKDEYGNYLEDPGSFEELSSYIGKSDKQKEFIIDYRDGKLEDSFGGAAESGLFLPSKEDTELYLKFIKNKDLEGIKKKRDSYPNEEGKIFPSILNIKTPLYKKTATGSITTINLEGRTIGDQKITLNKELKNSDGLVISDIRESTDYKSNKNIKYDETIDEQTYVVFEPEQIHILGSKQDIQGFKDFINNQNIFNQESINNNIDISNINPLYSAVFINTENLISKYPQVHQNLYSHHSTIEFKPKDISDLQIGRELSLHITGRLTTDNLDVLIVDNPLSKNKYPHITLSTAKGIAPVQSNSEIANNLDKIQPLDDYILGTIGVFDADTKTEITGFENYQEDNSFRDDDGNLIDSNNYVTSTFDSNNTMFDKSIKNINKEIDKLNKDLENSNTNIKSIISDSIVKQGIDPNQIKNEQRNEYSKLSSNMQKLGYKPLTENSFLKITSSAVEANNIGFDEDSYNYYNSPSKEITINSNGKYNVKVTYNAATSADNIKELKQQGIIEYDNNEIKKDIEEDEFLTALINNHFEGLLDSEKEIIRQKIKSGEYQIGCKL